MKITMAHGSGGQETSRLIDEIFARAFNDPVLSRMEDAAVVPGAGRLALTTDSFVVDPLFFPGGDIGRLCICGTVNDLLMSGATPRYLTCGFILEQGADIEDLQKIARSMADTAHEAGIAIVAGDTKVVEGKGNVYINTAGVGFVPDGIDISAANCREGDAVLLSGNLGDHHATILSTRMNIKNDIKSDCAPLGDMVHNLLAANIKVRSLRDVTRGGLATVLNEFARASHCCIELNEADIPVSVEVQSLCAILGLDPYTMGNEGKMIAVVAQEDAESALHILRHSKYGENAYIVGAVTHEKNASVLLHTALGGTRVLSGLTGEGLPRIC
ncbi:MAG: hydrogenase expression/formation protein HypE [Christensenella sp.]|uniref:hydrogenase expression/formation protein HypE n=1 Tax=Christensenella sp. TaxID=1935934 RepID=UPI002B2143E9|nr:hydrogenase expression/formation protein HypE [Christensenella sp.]MEA5004050.1 hydrogenase expression/formation protein HypE [Christensenella sp.]